MSTEDYSGAKAYGPDIATSYDADREVEEIWGLEQAYMQRVVAQIPEGSSLLDIPVGTGRFLPYYEGRKLKVLGVDISSSMLGEAKSKAVSSTTRLELGDARNLLKSSNCFEFVVCWRMLHLLPANVLGTVIRELGRVASGRLYLQGYVRDRWYYFLWLKSKMARIFKGRKRQSKTSPPSWLHIQSYAHKETMLLKVFAECGLSVESIDVLGLYGLLRVKVYVLSKA